MAIRFAKTCIALDKISDLLLAPYQSVYFLYIRSTVAGGGTTLFKALSSISVNTVDTCIFECCKSRCFCCGLPLNSNISISKSYNVSDR